VFVRNVLCYIILVRKVFLNPENAMQVKVFIKSQAYKLLTTAVRFPMLTCNAGKWLKLLKLSMSGGTKLTGIPS